MGSSGAAVVFAGGTVVIATAALAITGLGVLTSIGLSTALMVLFAVAAADHPAARAAQPAGRPDRHRPAGPPAPPRQARPRTPSGGASGTGSRAARGPTCSARSSSCVAIATPTLWIQTAFPAAGDAPASTTHRQAYDLLAEGFGTGFNGPLLVVVDLDAAGVDAADLPGLTEDIASIPRIVSVSEPQTSADGDTVVFTAMPDHGPGRPRDLGRHRAGP